MRRREGHVQEHRPVRPVGRVVRHRPDRLVRQEYAGVDPDRVAGRLVAPVDVQPGGVQPLGLGADRDVVRVLVVAGVAGVAPQERVVAAAGRQVGLVAAPDVPPDYMRAGIG